MPAGPWVEGKTFSDVLAATAQRVPGNDALVFPQLGLRWSYDELRQRVIALAKAFVAAGVAKGGHVGIWSTNWPEWVLAQFATAHIGAVLVNVNPAYRTQELAYILKQADLHTLLLVDQFKDSNYESMICELVPELAASGAIANPDYPQLRNVVSIKSTAPAPGIQPWPAFLALGEAVSDAELERIRAVTAPGDPVNIQYTSGTTGAPKGAMLSHRNLLLNAYYGGQCMHYTENDRVCIPVPFYHCFGCVLGNLMCVVYGAAMIIPAESFDPDATLDAVAAEKCTALYGVPTMFGAELHSPHFSEDKAQTLRTGIMAGSPCPIELMKAVTSKMHLPEMTIAYGLTEASPVITQSSTTEPLEIRVSTVGRVIPGVEAKCVDPATGESMPDGQQGELWARGHNIMLGYYKKPEATAEAITADGWLRTGDLAVRTPSGHFKITGRSKDVIIRGGENVYPRELEEYLLSHPAVRDVQVVGVPDARFGEQVSAWIVAKEGVAVTEDDIRGFCKGKIAHYKVPAYIVFVEEYPLTVTGKIQKYRLREMAVERFGLHAAAQTQTA
ncbi:MAG: AMP-binding protein [Candidatus Hydrogenedentes bacterium]|nr:AMP-binding protein [Candidatus Hydrogenedentota bacterium]